MEIREGTRKPHLLITIGILVHIDRTNQVPMPGKLAGAAYPISAFGFVFVPTSRTPARGSSFGAGEAHDVSLLRLVRQVSHIFPIFPPSQALIVVSPFVLIAHTLRIADEQGAHFLLNTKVDDLSGSFVGLHAPIPDLGSLHVGRCAALELCARQGIQWVDFYRLHGYNSTMNEASLQVGKTRYTHYSIAYHLVWIPKYRRRILTGEVQRETKRLIEACCERHGLTLLRLETDEDHIHVFVSAPPRFSPALIANLLKGYSSRYLREQFPHLKKVCGKDHLWTSSYYVGTAGNVSAEVIKRYIQECRGK
jgi:putative transposase